MQSESNLDKACIIFSWIHNIDVSITCFDVHGQGFAYGTRIKPAKSWLDLEKDDDQSSNDAFHCSHTPGPTYMH